MTRCSVGEIPALDTRLELAHAPEQGVDDTKHQRGLAHNESAAAQRPDGDDVEVGGNRQLAQEGAVALHRHRAHRDFRTAADEVEQADAKVACKPLVDDLHRRHAATDDALLTGDVVVAHLPVFENLLLGLLALPRDPFQEGIDLFLR